MKLFKLLISTMLILLCVQCAPAERRKSKAEDVIEKHLFETLDNYQSYEKISTEVDTLQDMWLANPEIMAFAGKLCIVEDNINTVDESYAQLDSRINTIHQQIYRGYSSGLELMQLLGNAADLREQKEELAGRKRSLDSTYAMLSDELKAMVSSLEIPKDPYWIVTQKFRISEDGQDSKIHLAHYIFDPNMKEIILSWDDNDIRVQRLINLMRRSINGSNEIFEAVTEDEEIVN